MASPRDRYYIVYLAKLAQQAERYSDMADAMKKLVNYDTEFTAEERSLLSATHKYIVGPKRDSWRVLSEMEKKEKLMYNVERIRDYRLKVESELIDFCNDAIKMIDDHLLPFASSSESSVFFLKMKGDYYRYLAEIKSGDEKEEIADQSLKAYEEGTAIAEADLPPTHPIRLGLALNFAVLYYEIKRSSKRACDLATEAYEESLDEFYKLNEVSKEYKMIMQLLKDNITLWED